MKTSIVVIGSSNMDLVAKAPQIPMPGQTLSGTDFFMIPGGKGANQAVAAAKLGGQVVFVGAVGDDLFGRRLLENLKKEGVKTSYVRQVSHTPSGVALIAVDDHGRNSIVVVPGANHRLTAADVERAEAAIADAAMVVCQLEIKTEVVKTAAALARRHGAMFILDPAPAIPLDSELVGMVDILKPNEVEAGALTGIAVTDRDSACKAADVLLTDSDKTVIITLGEKGLVIAQQQGKRFIDTIDVAAVDTTAAGDVFTGALAYRLATGRDIDAAAEFANTAAALSVTRMGAQPSMPTGKEVEDFIRQMTF